MRLPKFLLIIIGLILSCSSDNQWDCIKSTGQITTEFRYTKPFYKIEVHNKTEVEIYIDSINKIEITAGKNLIPKIETEQKDSLLIIKNMNRCNFMRDPHHKIIVKVYLPKLVSIHQHGYGNILLKDTITTDSISVFNEGNGDIHLLTRTKVILGASYAAGDIYLDGSTDFFYYHFNGSNFLFAKNLHIKEYAYISNYSIGDGYIYSTKWIEGELRSSGNLYYKGNPQILGFKITKNGKLIPIE